MYASDGDTLFAYICLQGVVCRGVCNVTAWVGHFFSMVFVEERKAAQTVSSGEVRLLAFAATFSW